MGGSYGFPSWGQDVDVDWSSLPTRRKGRMVPVTVRAPDGTTKQVLIEEGMDPSVIPMPEPPAPPPTIQDIIAQEDSFGGKLSKAMSFGMDPAGTVFGPDVHRQATEDLLGPPSTEGTYIPGMGEIPPWVKNAGRTMVEKGMQMASSPITAMFGVPGVAASIPGRLAAAGFGAMAAKGGGEQLGEVMAMRDAGIPMDDPEMVRALTSGALDLGFAPLAAAGALHGAPMARARAFERGTINPALERTLSKVEPLARDMGYTDAPGLSRVVPEGKPPKPVEPVVELRTDDKFTNNASGESAASIEALNRQKAEALKGRQRGVVDKAGNFRPLMAEGVDYVPRPGETTVFKTAEGFESIDTHAQGGGDLTAATRKLKPTDPQVQGKVRPLEKEPVGEFEIDTGETPSWEEALAEFDRPKTPTGADVPTSRIGELERIIASDKPADIRLQAMMELEDLVPPEVKTGIAEAKRTVRPANVSPEPSSTKTAGSLEKPPAPAEAPILKSINNVYDEVYGSGTRLKAEQLKEGREIWNELKKRKELPTQEDLRTLLAERGPQEPTVEKAPEVPPEEPPTPEQPIPKPSLEAQLKTAEARGQWSEVERLKKSIKGPEPELEAGEQVGRLREVGALKAPAVNPLEAQIPPSVRPERVNPVKVFTGEVAEPKPVAPVKQPKVIKEVDMVAKAVETETGASTDNPPQLNTPEGKKFVKSVAKNMGVTEEVAARMVGGEGWSTRTGDITGSSGQTGPTSSIGPDRAGARQGLQTATGQSQGRVGSGQGPGTILPQQEQFPAGAGGKGAGGKGPTGQIPPGSTGGSTPRLPKIGGKRPTLDILSWMRQRRTGDVLAETTRRKFESTPKGVQAQMDFESGKLDLPEVRQFLDRQHKLMRRAGVDVGYVENYLTHLWKETPQQVRQVLGKRLGLKPGIAMTRSIPTLAEGIQKGLTPKFDNMQDVLSWYSRSVNKAIADRGFFEWLREQKQIKPAGKAPYDWVTLSPDSFPIKKWKGNSVVFKAPKEIANKINEYLYDPASDPRAFVQGLQGVAKFSSFLKNIRLAAGVPFTKLNMHSFSVMAHHVLSTPTAKGVPNIPRMIGRGLKDFGEMLDPRLHKWTNEELSRARLMQKHGPLTLSTEDHVFAPAIKGSLLSRIKESKSPSKLFTTLTSRMFEEPLFQSHLPKMKLNVAWELQKEYRKGGMSKRDAFRAAGEVTNNMFGGLNLDEMGRSKMGQDLARILILAPDWLESNVRTVKEIAGSPLGRTPKEKTYRDFATNLLGVYVSGTILQKALTGRWMHENNPGSQFSIYLGKNPDNGKDRYVKPFGAGLAGVRLIYDSAESISRREDVGKLGELVRGRMAIPSGIAASTIFNKGPFGQPITKREDTLGGQLKSLAEYGAGQTVPQYVAGPVAALKGNISPELGLAQAIEFPYTEVKRRPPDEKQSKGGRSRRRRRR